MKNPMIVGLIVAGLLAGCGPEENGDEPEVSTIKPVKPEVTDDSEPDLSQTLEIGEDRSFNEGADLPGFEEEIESFDSVPPPNYTEIADEGQPVPPEKDVDSEDDPNSDE